MYAAIGYGHEWTWHEGMHHVLHSQQVNGQLVRTSLSRVSTIGSAAGRYVSRCRGDFKYALAG